MQYHFNVIEPIKISFKRMSGHVSSQNTTGVGEQQCFFRTCGKICSWLHTPLYQGMVLASITSNATVVVATMNNSFNNQYVFMPIYILVIYFSNVLHHYHDMANHIIILN